MAATDVVNIGGQHLECIRIGVRDSGPHFVFLHEGLGSVAMWKDFPRHVVAACGGSAIVYSRAGYGRSQATPLPRTPDYMHVEALVTLPRLLDHFGITQPVLVGHSDGASIALIYAGSGVPNIAATIALAPHVFVEPVSIAGIEAAKLAYAGAGLRDRLTRYHADVDAAFRGWNDIWLSPAFLDWNIEASVARVECPTLLIQGRGDEYGTSAQLDAIEHAARGRVDRVELNQCGHSPHRDQPEATVAAIVRFVTSIAT
jgi:pimeloyl-ACP methyl ester carboxylesterase